MKFETKTEEQLRYDNCVKVFLSQKMILAHIIVHTVEEFAGQKPEAVIPLIDGEPEISGCRVHPRGTNPEDFLDDAMPCIQGIGTEDVSQDEGTTYFDIRFCVYTPSRKNRLKLILDIEAQNDFYPGYDLVTRSIYYCARMLSGQKNREFAHSDYDSIKKVYSIWICVHVPKYAENTMTEYRICQRNIVGQFPKNRRYDLLSSVFICLSEDIVEKAPQYVLHRLLEIFFSTNLSRQEKMKLLKDEYGIVFNHEMERSVSEMCNVSVGILQKGFEKGYADGMEHGYADGMEHGYADGVEHGMEQGMEQGMKQLSNAIIYARQNHVSLHEKLVEAGFSEEVAEMAITLL